MDDTSRPWIQRRIEGSAPCSRLCTRSLASRYCRKKCSRQPATSVCASLPESTAMRASSTACLCTLPAGCMESPTPVTQSNAAFHTLYVHCRGYVYRFGNFAPFASQVSCFEASSEMHADSNQAHTMPVIWCTINWVIHKASDWPRDALLFCFIATKENKRKNSAHHEMGSLPAWKKTHCP